MKSLVKYLDEKLVIIPSQVDEKLVINKDYKSLSDDFCNEFEDDIEYILTKIDTIKMDNDIKKVLEETFYKGKKLLAVLDVIKEENLFNSKNKIFVAKGFVNVNSFYYKLFLKMSAYCEQHKKDKWIRYRKNDGHSSIYVLNTYKYYIIICGDNFQDINRSSSNIVIQEK